MRNLIIGGIAALALAGTAGLVFGLGGFMNVAATYPDPPPVGWFLHTTYRQSVERRSSDIQAPIDLGNRQQVLRGAQNFIAMCSGCHTPPGLSKTPVSTGLNPAPPDLAEIIPHRSPEEAFWVIKNGVRMTGMPAFGPTHKDEELWALVALSSKCPTPRPRPITRW